MFFYIKPHANTALTRQICKGFFESKGVEVIHEGEVSGARIDAEMMFDKQYANFADYALGNPLDAALSAEALHRFETMFGDTYEKLASEGYVLNCIEACELLQCSNDELTEVVSVSLSFFKYTKHLPAPPINSRFSRCGTRLKTKEL